MFEDVEIQFFKGTHRVRDPKETIEINENKLRTAGITRLTEITDLDRIKIPVFSAIRPTAQEGGVSPSAPASRKAQHEAAETLVLPSRAPGGAGVQLAGGPRTFFSRHQMEDGRKG